MFTLLKISITLRICENNKPEVWSIESEIAADTRTELAAEEYPEVPSESSAAIHASGLLRLALLTVDKTAALVH